MEVSTAVEERRRIRAALERVRVPMRYLELRVALLSRRGPISQAHAALLLVILNDARRRERKLLERLGEGALIYEMLREREERDGITVRTLADRLTYAVAGVINECPDRLTLAALESPCNVEALAEQYPEVREHYPAADRASAEEVRRFAVADLRQVLEDFEAERRA